MTATTTTVPNVKQAVPFFMVTDIDASLRFYVDGLGFAVQWTHQFEPTFPVFAELSRDGVALFLTEHTGDCKPGGACYIIVDDVDALYREITGRGVKPAEAPEDAPWGAREMLVVDPDDNRLRFANHKAK